MIYLVLFFTIICDILGKFFLAYLFMHAPFVQFDLATRTFFYFSFFFRQCIFLSCKYWEVS